jgi:hypothetical protein
MTASDRLSPAKSPRRLASAAAVLVLIACGLLWRRPELGLPASVAKYGGSILWGAMMFFVIAALLPGRDIRRIAVLAAIIAALVEASQLIHIVPLDQFRSTVIGALLLGRTFSWWDIASYWLGIAVACLATFAIVGWVQRRKAKPA